MKESIQNRYEFIMLFDCENGNPNGDPDAGNMPRTDSETGHGIVTDVCLKRKIRNYIEMLKENEKGFGIYIKENVPLNLRDDEAFASIGIENATTVSKDKLKSSVKAVKDKGVNVDKEITNYLCENYYDIRTFGAVITPCQTAALNCGQIRGPVQLSFARSIDPVYVQPLNIVRVTQTKREDVEKKGSHTFGEKSIIPYGLYRAEGYISANLAKKVTGFSDDDLALLWQAIINMFDCDHSAARGKMALRELIVFKHDSEFGNAPAYKLFDAVTVKRKDESKPARAYSDYEISINENAIPNGVSIERMV